LPINLPKYPNLPPKCKFWKKQKFKTPEHVEQNIKIEPKIC
jgi:hypothetical protein